MSLAPKNMQTNAEDGFCENHGLFYDIYCPECSPREDAIMAREIPDKDRRAAKRAVRLKKVNACDFCQKPSKRKLLGLCPTHHVYYCNDCSIMGMCPECCGIESTPIKPPDPSTIISAGQPADTHASKKKKCGCTETRGTEQCYCHDHDQWYCLQCTAGQNECPKCSLGSKVADSLQNLPECKCYEHGVRIRGVADFCSEHDVYFCKTCNVLCPLCKAKAHRKMGQIITPGLKRTAGGLIIVPQNYPMIQCPYHGWFCSRCDKDCPDCNHVVMKWQAAHCDKHKAYYCIRCGMGCNQCGKKDMRVEEAFSEFELPEEVESLATFMCPNCDVFALRDCPKHGFYCTNCDGCCQKCDGCFTRGGVKYHKCNHPMEYCTEHKKHYCGYCGKSCRLCPQRVKYHLCGMLMSICPIHKDWYCGKCGGCKLCKEENTIALGGKHFHHCGCPLLFCATHRVYFCPSCDNLCSCALDCGLVQRYYKPTYDDLQEYQAADLRREEFENWLDHKKELFDLVVDFHESWDDMVKFLFTALLCSDKDDMVHEEAIEKFQCVEQLFKSFCEMLSTLKADEDDSNEESQVGLMAWEDERGDIRYQDGARCPIQRIPTKITVTVKEFLGDDLQAPE